MTLKIELSDGFFVLEPVREGYWKFRTRANAGTFCTIDLDEIEKVGTDLLLFHKLLKGIEDEQTDSK